MIEVEKTGKMDILNWHFLKMDTLITKMMKDYKL
jgi:hypothetical protein